jgi:hypothetical protein
MPRETHPAESEWFIDSEAAVSGQDIEPLFLGRMRVLNGDEAARPNEGLEFEERSAGHRGGLAEDDSFAGDGVLNRLAATRHVRRRL